MTQRRDENHDNGQGTMPADMVLVPTDSYIVGTDQPNIKNPKRKCTVPAFFIDRYPVTNGRWREFRPDHRCVQQHPAAFGLVVPAAGRLLSRRSGGASGRAPPEVTSGQGAAKAGEHQAAAASTAFRGGPNRVLFEGGDCLTLIETNQVL